MMYWPSLQKRVLTFSLLAWMAFAPGLVNAQTWIWSPGPEQRWIWPRNPVPNRLPGEFPAWRPSPYGFPGSLAGLWFGDGNPSIPTQIIQPRPDGNALFINQHGSQAWGTIEGDRVWIPEWTDGRGSQGLLGVIRGDRIIWPNGSFWLRAQGR